MSLATVPSGARSLTGDTAGLARSTDGTGLAGIADEQLEHQVVTWSANLAAAMSHWLALVGEYDRRRLWEPWECASMAAWLSWHCGIDAVTAREHLRVARRLPEFPLVRAEFAAGRLSYSKVRELTRIATPATEADLVEIARSTTAAQLCRLGRGYRTARRNLDPAGQDARRGLHMERDDDGSWVGRFRLPGDAGAALVAAVRSAADGPTAEALVDALVGLVLARIEPGAQATLMVHVGIEHLGGARGDDPGVAEATGGTPITAEVARRIGCDGEVLACVDDADGNPLRLGRRRRVVSRPLRRALLRRDRGCRFPGCSHTRWLHAHHLVHWVDGGETEIDNMVMLCSRHHRAVHEHGWEIVPTPFGYDALPPDPWRAPPRPAGVLDDVEGAAESLPEPGWFGQPWDLATCIEVLLWTEDRHHRAEALAAAA